jgi:hypothetical protein
MGDEWGSDPRAVSAALVQQSGYFTAQVCLTGHTITDAVQQSPERIEKFCSQCGAETIIACPACETPIRGYYETGTFGSLREYEPPKYCYSCGTSFPWTKAKIEAAKEHASDLDHLSEDEKVQLQGAIDDIAAGGARTDLAVSRFKRLMKKAGQAVGSGLYKVAIDVASDAAKKGLLS